MFVVLCMQWNDNTSVMRLHMARFPYNQIIAFGGIEEDRFANRKVIFENAIAELKVYCRKRDYGSTVQNYAIRCRFMIQPEGENDFSIWRTEGNGFLRNCGQRKQAVYKKRVQQHIADMGF